MIWLQMREKWTIFSMRSEWFLFDFFTQFHVIPMLVSTFIIALISHFLYLSTTFWSVSFVYFSKWLMNLPETKISLFLTPFLPHSIVSVFIWNTSVLRHLLLFFPFLFVQDWMVSKSGSSWIFFDSEQQASSTIHNVKSSHRFQFYWSFLLVQN